MHYTLFLQQLIETGKAVVETDQCPSPEDISAGMDWLRTFEPQWRLTFSGKPPALDIDSASWAAESLYRACQLLMYRDLSAEEVTESLSRSCPGNEADPAVHYSVDLTFRFLPGLLKFSTHVSQNDPLSQAIYRWCCDWPLSSVGSTNLSDVHHVEIKKHLDFMADSSLKQLFADRIIDRKSWRYVVDSRVANAIRHSTCGLEHFADIHQQLGKHLEIHGS